MNSEIVNSYVMNNNIILPGTLKMFVTNCLCLPFVVYLGKTSGS